MLGSVLVGASLVAGMIDEGPPAVVAVELDWQAPRGCPTEGHVEATIARLVGQPIAAGRAGAGSSTQVRAVVRTRPEGFEVELHTRHGVAEEHRTFTAPRCDALADATALIVAVALRPLETAAAASTAAASEVAPDPPPSAVPPAPTVVAPRQRPAVAAPVPTARASEAAASEAAASEAEGARAVGGALAVTGGPAVGVLPGVGAQLAAVLALRGPRWRVEAGGTYWFPRTATTADQPTVEIGLGSGTVRGCYVLARSRLELPLCAGAELGAMRGRGQGAGVLSKTSRSLWAAAHAGPGLTWRLGPWAAVRLAVDVLVALRQPGFDLRIGGERVELHRVPPVGGRAALGIELRWP